MKTYLSGGSVSVTIDLTDDDGQDYEATSVFYRVFDEADVDVIAPSFAPGFVGGSTSVTITVGEADNTLAVGTLKGIRTIELIITNTNGTFNKLVTYAIATSTQLTKGVNSYQTLSEALLSSLDIPNLIAWESATEKERISALIEAHGRLGKLRYSIKSLVDSQNHLSMSNEINNMAQLSADELAGLPVEFLTALRKAQIAEADTALGGDPIDEQRRGGLMATSIGEVSQMYRPGAPLVMAVSARALRYLTGYVKFGVGIGRT